MTSMMDLTCQFVFIVINNKVKLSHVSQDLALFSNGPPG